MGKSFLPTACIPELMGEVGAGNKNGSRSLGMGAEQDSIAPGNLQCLQPIRFSWHRAQGGCFHGHTVHIPPGACCWAIPNCFSWGETRAWMKRDAMGM